MFSRGQSFLSTFRQFICLLTLALLASLGPNAFAFHDGDDDPFHLDLYPAEEGEFHLLGHVVYLTETESEELFSLASGQVENVPEATQLTLYLERLPSSLEGLIIGDILAAAVTPPETLYHDPWNDAPRFENVSERLAWDGLLHRVIALEEVDDGWKLQLEQAALADAIEHGTLITEAQMRIRSLSEEEIFGQGSYASLGNGHYRNMSLSSSGRHCETDSLQEVEIVENIKLQDGVEADIAYHAELHMTYALSFEDGQIENAELTAEICQDGSLKLLAANEIDHEWLLWKDRSRPKVFRVGLLPVVARAGGSLAYGLTTGTTLEQKVPMEFRHHLQRQVTYSQGNWRVTDPEFVPPTIRIPAFSPSIELQATSRLVPHLNVILYGLAGPYIQASGAVTMGASSSSVSPEFSLNTGLTLKAGIQQDNAVLSLCPLGECEKTLSDCKWDWDFDQGAFSGPRCE